MRLILLTWVALISTATRSVLFCGFSVWVLQQIKLSQNLEHRNHFVEYIIPILIWWSFRHLCNIIIFVETYLTFQTQSLKDVWDDLISSQCISLLSNCCALLKNDWEKFKLTVKIIYAQIALCFAQVHALEISRKTNNSSHSYCHILKRNIASFLCVFYIRVSTLEAWYRQKSNAFELG